MGKMQMLEVILDEGAIMPRRAHPTDAGLDLFSREEKVIKAKSSAVFDTGVHVNIPEGFVGMIKSKSGLNIKHDVQSEGVVDAGYTGAIVVKLYNHGGEDYLVAKGDKITQLVIMPIETPTPVLAAAFEKTERGDNGFGSSGRK